MSFTTTHAFDHKSLQQTLPPLLSLSQHIWDLGRCQFSSWQRTAGHTASHLALFHIYLVKTYWLLPGLIRDPRNLWMFMKNIFFRTSAKTWLLNRDEVMWNLKRKKKMTFSLRGFKKHSIHFTSNQFKPTVTSLSTALTSEDFWFQKVVLEVLWHSRKQNTMLRSIVPK